MLYKPQIDFLFEHAIDPDKRRYAVPEEGHDIISISIIMETILMIPYPGNGNDAVAKYSEDTLNTLWYCSLVVTDHAIPANIAFKEKNQAKILKYSAEIGHYMADSHVPLMLAKPQWAIHRSKRNSWILGKPYTRIAGGKRMGFFYWQSGIHKKPRRFYLETGIGKCCCCRYGIKI